jgi:hypothetical protein
MTIIRKLALALCLASLFTSYSNAQVDPTTGNLINYGTAPTGTTSTWNNGVYVDQLCFQAGQPGNCGPNPSVRPGGVINFSYGTADLNQVVNINTALAAGGTGVQLSGFNFSFMAKNGNGWDDARQDYLAAYVKLYGAGGNLVSSYDYSAATNQKYNWTNFNFNETFANPYVASTLSTAQVGFVGRDNNFWAGNYGPEVYNVNFRLKYKVDPCATNPAYSVTCAGFNNVLNTNNLLNSSVGGASLNQAFAVNTALQNAGVGAMVHGFNYGFNWRVGQGFFGCTAWNQDGSCSWTMNTPAYANATVSLTNKNNQTIHQQNYSFSGENTSGSVSDKFLLPTSLNQSMLGMGRIVGSTSGTGSSIEGAWATMIYTADPCTNNPLYSPDCKGYAAAIAKSLAPPPAEVPQNTVASTPDTTATAPPPSGSTSSQTSNDVQSPPPPGPTQTTTVATSVPASNNTQPRAGEVSVASAPARSSSGPSMSMIMSILSTESNRVGSVERSAVAAAVAGAEAAGTQATQQAEAVAGSLTSQSIAASLTSASGTGLSGAMISNQSQSSIFSLSDQSQSAALNTTMLRLSTQSSGTTETVSALSTISSNSVSVSLFAPTRAAVEVEMPQSEGIKFGGRSVLNDSIESRPMLQQATQERQIDAVNKNAQSNELAGGVDIAAINRQPVGFQNYSFVLTDAQFYAPREIYRNQRTIDNARALRQLTNDGRHREMVEQQYKRN